MHSPAVAYAMRATTINEYIGGSCDISPGWKTTVSSASIP